MKRIKIPGLGVIIAGSKPTTKKTKKKATKRAAPKRAKRTAKRAPKRAAKRTTKKTNKAKKGKLHGAAKKAFLARMARGRRAAKRK